MKPETTAELIDALNNSAQAHTYGEKDDTQSPPAPDSIPCTLAGELDTDENLADLLAATEEEADADEMPEDQDDAEQDQQDNEPSKSGAEKEQEKKEQEQRDATRWHDYALASLNAAADLTKTDLTASGAAALADALLARFKSRFPNA
jgi:hypothetical protein